MSTEAEDLGERIAKMAAHLDAATRRLLTDLRDYDRSGNWNTQGFADCAHWLSWRVGWALGTARDHLRVAQRLGDLPLIDDALRTGSISYSKVRAMTRVATPANEIMLLEDARHATGQQLEVICRKYSVVVRAAKEMDEDYDRQRCTVSRRDLDDGMVRIEATLHPEEAALVWAALDRIARERSKRDELGALAQDTTADLPQRAAERPSAASNDRFSRADALPAMANGVVRGDAPRRSPIELVVTVAADALHAQGARAALFADGTWVSAETADADATAGVVAEAMGGSAETADAGTAVFAEATAASARLRAPIAVFADGTCVSAETARRLACDSGIVHVTEDANGNTLTVGRRTRSIPAAIEKALLKRDRCCRFPGCSNRLYVEGHHIEHWADGGEHVLRNLVVLCNFHHRFVHEYGYSIQIDHVQQPNFFDPSGRQMHEVPLVRTPDRLGWQGISDVTAPLEIDADTNACLWDGVRPNYGDIIDALALVDGLQ